MAVTIKLKNEVFDKGGIFYGVDPSRAKLQTTGQTTSYSGKLKSIPGFPRTTGNSNILLIDRTGTDFDDVTFESIVNRTTCNYELFVAFGQPILEHVAKGYIDVIRDGSILSLAAIVAFTA